MLKDMKYSSFKTEDPLSLKDWILSNGLIDSSCICHGFVIIPVRMHLTACLVFCLVMIFLPKLLGLKIYFHRPSGLVQVLFLTLELIVKAKKKKFDPSNESAQSFHFSIWPKLEVIFYKIKGSSHEINLLCERKYKHEVEENHQVLAPIIDTIVTFPLGRLRLFFCGSRDDLKYHPKVGKYSTDGVGNFVDFPQVRVRGGDKVLEHHLKACSKN